MNPPEFAKEDHPRFFRNVLQIIWKGQSFEKFATMLGYAIALVHAPFGKSKDEPGCGRLTYSCDIYLRKVWADPG